MLTIVMQMTIKWFCFKDTHQVLIEIFCVPQVSDELVHKFNYVSGIVPILKAYLRDVSCVSSMKPPST